MDFMIESVSVIDSRMSLKLGDNDLRTYANLAEKISPHNHTQRPEENGSFTVVFLFVCFFIGRFISLLEC